ncbi:MAG: hypothetical protein HQL23_08330 [Candidatus Omnitrophica bacterium]|nr:hypothetical protein [Candidatus Omnitrophota bacterium]
MNRNFEHILETIQIKDPRYKQEAYEFMMEALTFTQKRIQAHRHVTGEELLDGAKDLVIRKFGPLAMTVLQHWGVKNTEDFGHLVFNLVENKILSKTEQDSIESFRNRYDFEDVFRRGYRNQLHKKISRMR